jgi:hypothetical protein
MGESGGGGGCGGLGGNDVPLTFCGGRVDGPAHEAAAGRVSGTGARRDNRMRLTQIVADGCKRACLGAKSKKQGDEKARKSGGEISREADAIMDHPSI